MGRFISRDPLGYVDGFGLYNGYFAGGFNVDPIGLESEKPEECSFCKDKNRTYIFCLNCSMNDQKTGCEGMCDNGKKCQYTLSPLFESRDKDGNVARNRRGQKPIPSYDEHGRRKYNASCICTDKKIKNPKKEDKWVIIED